MSNCVCLDREALLRLWGAPLEHMPAKHSPRKAPTTQTRHTVLLAIRELYLKQLLEEHAGRALQVVVTDRLSDLGRPGCMLAYVDAALLDAPGMDTLASVLQGRRAGPMVLVVGHPPPLPPPLDLLVQRVPAVWNRRVVAGHLRRALALAEGTQVRQRAFHDRVRRIVLLHYELRASSVLAVDRVLERHGITERTLRRDLKVLRDVFPDLDVTYERPFRT